MDESWRMRMGSSSNLPRRRSTEETSSTLHHHHHHRGFDNLSDSESLDPEDFHDVFGGPPRTLLSRKASSTATEFDFFRSSGNVVSVKKGRNLPVFRIPPAMESGEGRRRGVYQRKEGFYDDIFGSEEDTKSRSKVVSASMSKSNSSSVLSSEDLSPLRPSIAEDVFFSSFSSKLRPINIPSQRNLSSTLREEQHSIQGKSDTPPWLGPSLVESHLLENNSTKNYNSSPFKFFRSDSSPEANTIEPNSYRSIKASLEDIEIDSPSSAISSLSNRDVENKLRILNRDLQEEEEEDDEEEEIMSSYVIEISCEKRKETTDESEVAIDEAIAWAKEKFQKQSMDDMGGGVRQTVSPSATEPCMERPRRLVRHEQWNQQQDGLVRHEHWNQQQDGYGIAQFLMVNEKLRNWIAEERQ